jgi:ribosomal protein L11 methyltransferase
MLELAPEGFEERELACGVELAVYTGDGREEDIRRAFGAVRSAPVEEGWEQRWRTFHRPVRVGSLWVGPPWAQPDPEATAVVIDPGRAFGTGAHATTRLCLELLGTLEGGSLLDVGCGSGVLAIAAAKLGFAPVHAVDLDPAAIEATSQNAARNGVELWIAQADAVDDALPEAETAVANVSRPIVEQVAQRARCSLLVTSGYLAGDEPSLPGFRRRRRAVADGWAAGLFERTQ